MSERNSRQPLSRAEQLRQQRQPFSRVIELPEKQNVPGPSTPVVNPFGKSSVQPGPQSHKPAVAVTTRSYPYSTPLRESVATPERRKTYRVASNGVETRLPSMPHLKFSWQWVSGFMTFALLVLVILMIYLPTFKVQQVQVEGLQFLAQEDVQAVVTKAAGSIFTLDRNKIEKAVGLAFPDLKDINLRMDKTGKLILSVTERQPVMAWKAGDHEPYWFDADGVVMPARGDSSTLLTVYSDCGIPFTKPTLGINNPLDYANLVLNRSVVPVTQNDLINTLNPDVMKALQDLSAQMPSGTLLVFDYISGVGWKDPRGWKIYFGLDLTNIQFKLVEYQAIVDALSAQGISPNTISVAHIDSPYYRTK